MARNNMSLIGRLRYGYVHARWYVNAVRDYPSGIFCKWCGRFNTMFDDCGFWWIAPHGNGSKYGSFNGDGGKVCCQHCYDGALGRAHIARYGQGER